MKLILVGIGSFGYEWYRRLKDNYRNLEVAVVDSNENAREIVEAKDRFYTSLEEAIEREKPDFIMNVTPPNAHTMVNETAFNHNIPVLCEKPIAGDYHEAAQVVERADFRQGLYKNPGPC